MSERDSEPGAAWERSAKRVELPPSAARRRWLSAGRWLLLAACLWIVVEFLRDHREDLDLVSRIDPGEVILVTLLSLLFLVAQSYRYQVILEQCSGRRLGFRAWLPIFVLGRFVNTLVPQGGNLYRAVELKRRHGIAVTRYVTSFVSFAWLDTCLNLLIASLLLATLGRDMRLGGAAASLVVLGLTAIAIALPVALEYVLGLMPLHRGPLARTRAKLAEILQLTLAGVRDPRFLGRVAWSGLLVLALAVAIIKLCFSALGQPVELTGAVVFYVLLKLGGHVSLTPANLGVQEIAFGLLGLGLGVGAAQGVLVSAMLRLAGSIALFAVALPMGGLRLAGHLRRQLSRRRADAA